ncbi:serine hydrolase domain-containing protein [Sphaerisporangium aureirubrum]|uniref:Serine hydrolase domain-containing protein n=1 Tax=Sphaerisporangium aureirubrum TaxID=1544736 RepID=A0ABW1NR26_9ACTN
MSDLQQQVQNAIDELVASGTERGLQVAVYKDGELVVDAVAGLADAETGRALTGGTPIYSSSTGKSLTSAVVHVLAEQGVLDYDAPIADVWPEFAAHGKQGATLRQVLDFTVGVPGVPADTTPDDLVDWDKMTAALADSEPWWEPGTKVGYHPQTFGYLVGEVVRRATGKPISVVLAEQIAGPLGIADEVYFGVPSDQLDRVAKLEAAGPPMDMDMLESMMPTFFKIAPRAVQLSPEMCNRADYLGADIPAGGTVTARGVAKIYAALIGEVDGVRLISPERLAQISQPSSQGVDEIFSYPTAYGLGYNLARPVASPPAGPIIGWPGAGGSLADADLGTGTSLAVTKVSFTPGDYTTVGVISDIVTKSLTPA